MAIVAVDRLFRSRHVFSRPRISTESPPLSVRLISRQARDDLDLKVLAEQPPQDLVDVLHQRSLRQRFDDSTKAWDPDIKTGAELHRRLAVLGANQPVSGELLEVAVQL